MIIKRNNKTRFLIGIALLVFANNLFAQSQCDDVFISNKIYSCYEDSLVKDMLWNGYDPNADGYPIPDSFIVQTGVTATDYIFGGDSISSFTLSVSFQVKVGVSGFCIQVINPIVLPEEFLFKNKKFNEIDFFKDNKKDIKEYSSMSFCSKADLSKYIEGMRKKGLISDEQKICQIIINSYLTYNNGTECFFEYIQPVCSQELTTPYSYE